MNDRRTRSSSSSNQASNMTTTRSRAKAGGGYAHKHQQQQPPMIRADSSQLLRSLGLTPNPSSSSSSSSTAHGSSKSGGAGAGSVRQVKDLDHYMTPRQASMMGFDLDLERMRNEHEDGREEDWEEGDTIEADELGRHNTIPSSRNPPNTISTSRPSGSSARARQSISPPRTSARPNSRPNGGASTFTNGMRSGGGNRGNRSRPSSVASFNSILEASEEKDEDEEEELERPDLEDEEGEREDEGIGQSSSATSYSSSHQPSEITRLRSLLSARDSEIDSLRAEVSRLQSQLSEVQGQAQTKTRNNTEKERRESLMMGHAKEKEIETLRKQVDEQEELLSGFQRENEKAVLEMEGWKRKERRLADILRKIYGEDYEAQITALSLDSISISTSQPMLQHSMSFQGTGHSVLGHARIGSSPAFGRRIGMGMTPNRLPLSVLAGNSPVVRDGGSSAGSGSVIVGAALDVGGERGRRGLGSNDSVSFANDSMQADLSTASISPADQEASTTTSGEVAGGKLEGVLAGVAGAVAGTGPTFDSDSLVALMQTLHILVQNMDRKLVARERDLLKAEEGAREAETRWKDLKIELKGGDDGDR